MVLVVALVVVAAVAVVVVVVQSCLHGTGGRRGRDTERFSKSLSFGCLPL